MMTVDIRTLHVAESHAKADGGVTTVVNDLSTHLAKKGVYNCKIDWSLIRKLKYKNKDLKKIIGKDKDFAKKFLKSGLFDELF